MLELIDLSMRFGGIQAVDALSLVVPHGAIFGLIGPNGSGKTTTINLISGLYTPTSGQVRLGGELISGLPAHRISRRGVVRTFQNIRLFADMSVLDNIVIFQTKHAAGCGDWLAPGFTAGERAKLAEARALAQRLGLSARQHELAGRLSLGDRKRLEIARALAAHPRILLLDEPAGGMSLREIEHLALLLVELRAEGLTILLIEHNMKFVMEISTRIAVLNFGRRIAEGTPTEIRTNPTVIEAYLGRD